METTNYIPRAQAARTIMNEGQRHSLVVYADKADGSERRMVCRLNDRSVLRGDNLLVWDVENGGYRTINVCRVKAISIARPPRITHAASKPASWDEARQEAHNLFY